MVQGSKKTGNLKKGWGENKWKRTTRFRLGNQAKEGKYWEKGDKKVCRLCGGKEETWEQWE